MDIRTTALVLAMTAVGCATTSDNPCYGPGKKGMAGHCVDVDSGPGAGCDPVCSGTTPRCIEDTNTCVECITDEHCTEAGKTHCNDAHVCEAECTKDDESRCNGNSCDPATNTCTVTPVHTVGVCAACKADSECMGENDRCIALSFKDAPRGGYCLTKISAGCPDGIEFRLVGVASLSGEATTDYCGVSQADTTCEAVLALKAEATCTAPEQCGAADVDDGLCETVNGAAGRCTYACHSGAECPGSTPCPAEDGYCGQ